MKWLCAIFLIALFLRVYRLSELPVGFHADEVRVAWNTYSLLRTGLDDQGNKSALYYNTFGDFRPTGIFYISLPGVALFGPSILATRLPAAILGALSIFPLYFLALSLTRNKSTSLFASFFLSISPWHITPSRSTSEVVISLFFILCGMVLILQKKYLWSFILLSLSLFMYHSARVVVPLFAFANFVQTKSQKSLFLFLAVSSLAALLLLSPSARGRFQQVSLTTDKQVLGEYAEIINSDSRKEDFLFHNRPGFYIKKFLDEYTSYLSSSFLTSEKVLPTRYATGTGLVSYTALLFIILGVISSIKSSKFSLLFLLLAASIIPAAMTTEDAPNMHRALFMIPFVAIFAGIGFESVQNRRILSSLLLIIFCLQIFSFWHMYRKHSPEIVAETRNSGTFELLEYLDGIDDDGEKIYLSNEPDELYPWFAIYYKLDPKEFNEVAIHRKKGEWDYRNYQFTHVRCPSDNILTTGTSEKVIVVDRGEMCGVEQKLRDGIFGEVIQEIKHPNGEVAFTVWQGKIEE
jgi:hypothetical protein